MTRPSPRLRAAILLAIPAHWMTVREIAKCLDLWSWQAVRSELCIMADEGLIAKRMEQKAPNQLLGFYQKVAA